MSIDAGSIMTREVISVDPENTVASIARKMAEHGISAVPVCDGGGQLLGMVSEGDLMRPFGEENQLRRAWWLTVLGEGTDLAPAFVEYVRLDQRRAKDLMSTPVITAAEDTSLPQIADLLEHHRIKRVPIVRQGKLVGVVSRADIIRTLSRSPQAIVDQA